VCQDHKKEKYENCREHNLWKKCMSCDCLSSWQWIQKARKNSKVSGKSDWGLGKVELDE